MVSFPFAFQMSRSFSQRAALVGFRCSLIGFASWPITRVCEIRRGRSHRRVPRKSFCETSGSVCLMTLQSCQFSIEWGLIACFSRRTTPTQTRCGQLSKTRLRIC